MKRHQRFKPYIRRQRPSDKAEDLRTALRLGILPELSPKTYVLVQRGCPGVLAVGLSRREVQRSILSVTMKQKTFRRWQMDIKRRSQGR